MLAPRLTISAVQPDGDYALLAVRGAIDREAVTQVERRVDELLLVGVAPGVDAELDLASLPELFTIHRIARQVSHAS